ncbi:MAG: peptide deformylase [Oscillospiraceae bacterium]|jgi:peptide deformylase|nr:peptide deformylase [Oscillospiraceae bacterium]
MAIRKIVYEGDEMLTKKCRKVDKFDERLHELLDDMKETMYKFGGVGLAAPQVGILRRVAVVDAGDGFAEMVNPEIVESSGEQMGKEGCMSCPGQWGITLRPMIVKVQAQNRFGEKTEICGRALKARALCHEIDHLDGILFKSRVVSGNVKL